MNHVRQVLALVDQHGPRTAACRRGGSRAPGPRAPLRAPCPSAARDSASRRSPWRPSSTTRLGEPHPPHVVRQVRAGIEIAHLDGLPVRAALRRARRRGASRPATASTARATSSRPARSTLGSITSAGVARQARAHVDRRLALQPGVLRVEQRPPSIARKPDAAGSSTAR